MALAELNGTQIKQLHGALKQAFRSKRELARFVTFELNERLDNIIQEGPFDAIVFDLIEWANARGLWLQLTQKAYKVTRHSELKTCLEEFLIRSPRSESSFCADDIPENLRMCDRFEQRRHFETDFKEKLRQKEIPSRVYILHGTDDASHDRLIDFLKEDCLRNIHPRVYDKPITNPSWPNFSEAQGIRYHLKRVLQVFNGRTGDPNLTRIFDYLIDDILFKRLEGNQNDQENLPGKLVRLPNLRDYSLIVLRHEIHAREWSSPFTETLIRRYIQYWKNSPLESGLPRILVFIKVIYSTGAEGFYNKKIIKAALQNIENAEGDYCTVMPELDTIHLNHVNEWWNGDDWTNWCTQTWTQGKHKRFLKYLTEALKQHSKETLPWRGAPFYRRLKASRQQEKWSMQEFEEILLSSVQAYQEQDYDI